MKIQCDVCATEAASVFCCADEAALCDQCDHRVHRANKLASKHHRFSLHHPSSNDPSPPLCDICQEKKGFLFCREDRAVLCRDCDAQVHSANELTMQHTRFLLTGVRFSAAPAPALLEETETTRGKGSSSNRPMNTANSDSSSISDYLIKMLPGWHVDEFLSDDAITGSNTKNDYCKTDEASSHLLAMDRLNCMAGVPTWVCENSYDWALQREEIVKKKNVFSDESVSLIPWQQGTKERVGHKRSRVSVRYL